MAVLPAPLVCERAERLVTDAGFVVSFRPSEDGRWPIIATARIGDQVHELGRFEQEPLEDDSLENQASSVANLAIALYEERRDSL